MSISDNLRRVIESNARLWAGEAEVFRTYWTWSGRTRATDKQWLAYQCYKEVWSVITGHPSDGLFMGTLRRIEAMFPKIDLEVDRHAVLDEAEGLWAEFAHYCAFADAYEVWDHLTVDENEFVLDPAPDDEGSTAKVSSGAQPRSTWSPGRQASLRDARARFCS